MSKFKSHINTVGYKLAFFVTKFVELPIIHNSVTRKVFDYSKTNIRVLNDLVSLLWTRIAENNLSKLFHDLNPCNADNLRHGLPTERSVIKIECLQGGFEYICY